MIDLKEKQDYTCSFCSKPFYARRKIKRNKEVFCSPVCANTAHAKVQERPDPIEISRMLKNGESYVSLGKKYGVSDNAVKKWMVRAGLYEKSQKDSVIYVCTQCGKRGVKEYNRILNKRGELKKNLFCGNPCFQKYQIVKMNYINNQP